MNTHELYINRCLQIAKNGLGTTRPNPMVGSVIVYNNTIIGEGYTSKNGGNHAEVNAIASVKNKLLLKHATIYVTLEPCAHYGKTPPCSDLIIKHNIPNIVIGCIDDFKAVAGKGIQKLKDAGRHVVVGVLEDQCKQHHKRFFTFHNQKRPYIILKWAQTTNGFIAPLTKTEQKPVWITNKTSRQLVHKWRAQEQAILTGTNTVTQDNPSLTTRDWAGSNPTRIIIDKDTKLKQSYNVFNNEAKTIIINKTTIDFNKPIASQICNVLYKHNITSVIIEGGKKTLQTFIDEQLWDEARIFTGDLEFKQGIEAPNFKGKLLNKKNINNDTLKIYANN